MTDYMPNLIEVDSLGDEALLLDLGIKPNSIYLTHHDLIRFGTNMKQAGHVLPPYEVDICVFNLSTKTLEPFLAPSSMSLKNARWIFSI